MRISTRGRYSLEALLYMALLPPGEYASTRTIAEHTGISEGYLEQLFIALRRARIVQGIRGPQGGYVLGRERKSITVGDILRAVEGSLEPVECISANGCPLRQTCGSRQTWLEVYKEIVGCADSLSLDDLTHSYETLDQIEYMI
ncbi:MAG: Rrf2 family transcriptional regulator [Treponema sp.]|jgi:Rrf2 family protein|nr:Rrf2 family transcriptional regulator [Treponema sp.]